MTRRLVSAVRRVAHDRVADYLNAWAAAAAAIERYDAHAWLFRAADGSARFVEFVEFGEGRDPREAADVRGELDALDAFGEADVEEWAAVTAAGGG